MRNALLSFLQQIASYASHGWKVFLLLPLIVVLSWNPSTSFAEKQEQNKEKILPKEENKNGKEKSSIQDKEVHAAGKQKTKLVPKKSESQEKKEPSAKNNKDKHAKNNLWPPLQTLISSPFGVSRSISGGQRHSGLDIRAHLGWPVCSLRDGIVCFTGRRGPAGLTVMIRQEDGKTVSYCHLSRCLVTEGTKVEKGMHIGLVGCTGRTTGAHLHISVKKDDVFINPRREIKEAWELFDPPLSELNGGLIEAQTCNGAIQSGSGPANAGFRHPSGAGYGFNPRLEGNKRYLALLRENGDRADIALYDAGRGKRNPRLRGNAHYVRMRKALQGLNTGYIR